MYGGVPLCCRRAYTPLARRYTAAYTTDSCFCGAWPCNRCGRRTALTVPDRLAQLHFYWSLAMSIVARALALVTPSRPARASGACMAPLFHDPYSTAHAAGNDTLRALLAEATKMQNDPRQPAGARSHYRRCSSVYWLECLRRGLALSGAGWEVLHEGEQA